ncbi:WavE lipopolysaccharide synthesis family protein [Motilimonas sp. E26]|uniref:WavE lipopolysaccharide synthesis family protein n=1 Tax=Motilimonas sp. E26 TaxID=2865674 RepID=UPI001E2CF93C|nr:WavE lipopolysaccharide synthesis family protein [Motilimonas sp. E26]MCE0558860.1 WavE lipopolysaccharide synthesis family protein [Motilimonas sp. E26]
MRFEDITIVVQGPVQNYAARAMDEGITQRCLQSIRTYLPGAKIILSTWHDQDLDNLDFDQLLLNKDPGTNIRYFTAPDKPKLFNNNRQIVSTLNGLAAVTTKYALKLRTDNYLISNEFIALFEQAFIRQAEQSVFQQRIVISNTFSRKYAKGKPVAYHLSDFFYFGLTQDLLKLWDIPLQDNYDLSQQQQVSTSYPYFPIDCTQMFWQEGLKQFNQQIELLHLHDLAGDKLKASEAFIANNLIIAEPEKIGLALCQKFLGKSRANRTRGKCSFYQLSDWYVLYKKYCDPTHPLPYLALFKLFLQRLIYVFPSRFETKMKIISRTKKMYRYSQILAKDSK